VLRRKGLALVLGLVLVIGSASAAAAKPGHGRHRALGHVKKGGAGASVVSANRSG
jgi:hypothetical protein